MGRNKATSVKPRNSNPVFKLAGGKAGKAKGKTQEVTSRLKHISKKVDHKDAVEKLDSQMVTLQQSGVSFAKKGSAPEEKKKVEAVQLQPDVPAEDIEDMIVGFSETKAGDGSKKVDDKTESSKE